MASQLENGRWRGRVRDPRTSKQVDVHKAIGGPRSYATKREAGRAEDAARDELHERAMKGVTVAQWRQTWLNERPWTDSRGESTILHNTERTGAFTAKYGDWSMRAIDAHVVAKWIEGGKNLSTIPALRAMFSDACTVAAGLLIPYNPFANLGLKGSRGRKDRRPPKADVIAQMLAAADELCPPSFALYLWTACFTAMRPGELDALRWTNVYLAPGAEAISVERQWNVKARKFTPPKHDSYRTISIVEPLLGRLHAAPRESEYVFATIRGKHYVPSTRSHHWNRVRAAVGLGNVELYLSTRHAFGSYALNVLGLPDHVIAGMLGHDDGGTLVRKLYGHPDDEIGREKIREAFRTVAFPTPLPRRKKAA
jgi:integrase